MATAGDPLQAVPSERREHVCTALLAAFGSTRIETIEALTGGASGAFPYAVLVAARRYVVRVEGPASPLRNPHQYVSMRIAAEAGIAPAIHYVDEPAGVAVMDFVEAKPIVDFPGGKTALAQAIGAMLRAIQATPVFPEFVTYPDMVTRLWAWVCQTGLFAPKVLDHVTEHLEQVKLSYAWNSDCLSSGHNDLVPNNVLFDGRRLWLIDWESAYANDPLVDVATALDNFAATPELEEALLRVWLGRHPDVELLARLKLARAFSRLYYAGVLLSASAAAFGPIADKDLFSPTLDAFGREISAGRLVAGMPSVSHMLGKMYVASSFPVNGRQV